MSFTLSNLKPAAGSRTSTRRIGRGPGSGRGTTAGKGTKGQRARSGGRRGLKRIGLKRIMQRIPKHRGFTSIHKKPQAINVGILNERLEAGVITPQILEEAGLVHKIRFGVKLVGDGAVTKAFTVRDCAASKTAREKIEKAGGKIV